MSPFPFPSASRGPLLAALAVAGLLVLTACGDSVPVAERLERAEAAREKGELRAAAVELKKVLRAQPDRTRARHMLGEVHLAMANPAAAEKELRRALELGRPREMVLYPLGRALLKQGDTAKLLAEIQPKGHWPSEARGQVLALRARAYLGQGDREAALDALDQAEAAAEGLLETGIARIELAVATDQLGHAGKLADELVAAYPDSPRAWRRAARIALQRQDMEGAEKALTRAIELSFAAPRERIQRAQVRLVREDLVGAKADIEALKKVAAKDHPEVLYTSALLDWAEGNRAEACDGMAEAVRQGPAYAPARVYLGACQYRDAYPNRALATLQEIPLDQRGATAVSLMAAASLALGDPQQARDWAAPLVDSHPEDPGLRGLMARIEMELGNTESALDQLRQLARLKPEDPDVRLKMGLALLQAGETEAGRGALNEALQLKPNQQQAEALLVLSHLRNGEHGKALTAARRLIDENPEDPWPYNLLGRVHLDRDRPEEAEKAFRQAVEKAPGDPGARHHLARLARERGDLAAARSHYEAVLEARDEHVGSLVALAQLEAESGNPEVAEERLRDALDADPSRLLPRILLARLLLGRGEAGAALSTLKGPEARLPQVPRALLLAAQAHLALDQPGEAVGPLRTLIRSGPESPESLVLLARAYEGTGETDKAREQIKRAAKVAPDNPKLKLLLARVHLREDRAEAARQIIGELPEEVAGHPWGLDTRAELAVAGDDLQRATELYRQVLEKAPSSRAAINLSQVHRAAGNPEAARQVLERWLRDHSGDAQARMALGNIHFRAGRREQAITAYRRVLRHDPGHAQALNNLAWLLREDSPEEALDLAEKAVEISGGAPRILDTLGMVLLARGDNERAARRLREVVDKAPALLDARYHLSQALAGMGRTREAERVLEEALATEGTFAAREEARAFLQELQARDG